MNYSLVYAGTPGFHGPPGPQRGPGSPGPQRLPGSAGVPANPGPQAFTGQNGLPAPSGSPGAPGQMGATGTKLNYHIELLVCQMLRLFTCECICRDNSLFDDRSAVTLSKC